MDDANPARIIICDDHKLFRYGIKMMLKDKPGIKIIGESENGQQLLDMLKQQAPNLVILNISMPVLDGPQTLPLIREKYPAIRVIILSMHNDPAMICRMLELGASSYLHKESGSNEIYDTIKGCMRQWFFVTPVMKRAIIDHYTFPGGNGLTIREMFNDKDIRILQMLAREESLTAIAAHLDLSPRTVGALIDRMKRRADVKTDAELVKFAVREKLIAAKRPRKAVIFSRLFRWGKSGGSG